MRRGGLEVGKERKATSGRLGDALDLDMSGGYLSIKELQAGRLRLIQFTYLVM